ncbi:MAG TPA: hypothetical protein VMX57_04160, partial [Planctomycetota bacterium]|nr:hypothetical protein [Planctomycetota bacterium]
MEGFLPLLVAAPLGLAFLIAIIAHVRVLKALAYPVAILAVASTLVLAVMLLGQGPLNLYVGGWGVGG